MRVLVTGGSGLVGGHLTRRLVGRHELHTADRHPGRIEGATTHLVELSDVAAFAAVMDAAAPEVVVHTAYSTADLDRDVVAAGRTVIDACAASGASLIHISTDAVFSGRNAPYDEAAIPHPVHPYGVAKREVETYLAERHPTAAVIRTSLIVHLAADGPDGATAWVVDANRRGERVTLFHDEYRTAVRLADLLDVLEALVELPVPQRGGVWHVAGPERLSRAELGAVIAGVFDLDPSLIDAASAAEMAAPRPRDVSLRGTRVRDELHLVALPVATVPVHGQAQR